jgi:hypothetical protein
MTVRCRECYGENVQTVMWVRPNGHDVVDDFGSFDATDTNWCEDCDKHVKLYDDDTEPPPREDCPACGSSNEPMGALGERTHYRCRQCGLDYSDDGKDADTSPEAFKGAPS